MTLAIVLCFPALVTLGYAAAWLLAGRDPRALVGRAGLLLYASLLAVPLLAVVRTNPDLPWHPAPAWALGGVAAGWALWRVQRALARREAAPLWAGAAGWTGYARLMALVACLVVAEEVVWRGYLLAEVGLVASSLAFAAHHYFFGPRHVAFTALAGLAWGGLYLLSGSLVPPVASHLVFNVLAWHHLRASRPLKVPSAMMEADLSRSRT